MKLTSLDFKQNKNCFFLFRFYCRRRHRSGPRIGGVGTEEPGAHVPLSPTLFGGANNIGLTAIPVGPTAMKNGHRSAAAHSGHCSSMAKSGIKPADTVRMLTLNAGSTSGSGSYNRSHITGASSSSASGKFSKLSLHTTQLWGV